MANWMIACLALLVAVNLFASFAVARSPSISLSQRLVQGLFVWLLPIVGATIVLAFMAADRHSRAESLALETSLYPGDETTMAQGPSPCGCSTDGGGGDD